MKSPVPSRGCVTTRRLANTRRSHNYAMTLPVEAIGRLPIHVTERMRRTGKRSASFRTGTATTGDAESIQINCRLRVAALWRAANPLYKRRHVRWFHGPTYKVIPAVVAVLCRWNFVEVATIGRDVGSPLLRIRKRAAASVDRILNPSG